MKKLLLVITAALLVNILAGPVAAGGKGKGISNKHSVPDEAKQKMQEEEKNIKEKQDKVNLDAKRNLPPQAQKQAADTAKEPNKAMGLGHQMHLQAIDEQMSHEQAKYLERQARLERIVSLAKEKGNQKLADKAEELKQKEKERYESLTKKLADRKQRIMENSQNDSGSQAKEEIRQYRRGREREKIREMEEEKIRQDANRPAQDANRPANTIN